MEMISIIGMIAAIGGGTIAVGALATYLIRRKNS